MKILRETIETIETIVMIVVVLTCARRYAERRYLGKVQSAIHKPALPSLRSLSQRRVIEPMATLLPGQTRTTVRF